MRSSPSRSGTGPITGRVNNGMVRPCGTDLTDAEAICEAVPRPQMRFVPIKTLAQLDVQALHRARDRLVGMRTGLINQIRGFLLERGLSVERGRRTLEKALPALLEDHAQELGAVLRQPIECLRAQWRAVDQPIAALDEQILALARQDATSQRLMAMPGVGPLLATALVAAVGSSAAGFRSGRSLAAWLGLVPRQHSTGGKAKLLGVARHGNRYLRRLPSSGISPDVPAGNGSIALRSMVHAARSLKRAASGRDDRLGRWLQGLEARAHANVATVALAAKLARFAPRALAMPAAARMDRPPAAVDGRS